MKVTPITPHIGAEIRGLDLSSPVDNETFVGIHQAFLDWGVLVFREQTLTRDEHKAFARRFGKLHTHPMNDGREEPEVLLVKTTKDSAYTAGNGWHTDVTCDAYPPMGSMLYMKQVPGYGGGDTMYADMYLAYEMLSETMKELLSGLIGVHDGALPYVGAYKSTPPEGGYPKNEHPVVVTHPDTGRKVLYVNSGFTSHIKGLSQAESKALLGFLFDHIASVPRLTCRVSWEPGTLTFWDNRCTQHHAIWDYYPHERYGERVSIVADERPVT